MSTVTDCPPAGEHTCHRGPVCYDADGCGDCDHSSCVTIMREWDCRACEAMEPYTVCDRHGYQTIVNSGTSTGFAGGTVYWANLACGCFDVDESDDVRAAR